MATATKKRKTTRKVSIKKSLVDLNSRLVNTSEEVIDGTVLTGEKYQKLFAKTVKKSEPIIEKQVDIVFDTLEELKDQYQTGAQRFRKLIGWKDIKKSTKNTLKSIRKSAEDRVDAIQNEVQVRAKSVGIPTKVKSVQTKAKKVTNKVAPASKNLQTDLKVIDGIGPKMEGILKAGGIKTVEGLAKSSVVQIEKAIAKSGSTFRAVNSESWLKQAKQLSK